VLRQPDPVRDAELLAQGFTPARLNMGRTLLYPQPDGTSAEDFPHAAGVMQSAHASGLVQARLRELQRLLWFSLSQGLFTALLIACIYWGGDSSGVLMAARAAIVAALAINFLVLIFFGWTLLNQMTLTCQEVELASDLAQLANEEFTKSAPGASSLSTHSLRC